MPHTPYTTGEIPAKRSMTGLIISLTRLEQYSERKVAVSKLNGTATTTAIAVTHNVPTIKPARPNSPFIGCQENEKNNSLKPLISKTGFALRYNPKAMKKTKLKTSRQNNTISLRVTISLISLIFIKIIPKFLRWFHALFWQSAGLLRPHQQFLSLPRKGQM